MTLSHESRPRIVIADDHPSVLGAFVRMLEPGCDVVAAVPSGRAAVEAVGRLNPDILLVDLMLPDVNGLEVCRRVKRAAPATDVIIVTAFADVHMQAAVMQDGAAAFVSKHSAAVTLESTIQRIHAVRRGQLRID